jgi:Ammonium Transporter Family
VVWLVREPGSLASCAVALPLFPEKLEKLGPSSSSAPVACSSSWLFMDIVRALSVCLSVRPSVFMRSVAHAAQGTASTCARHRQSAWSVSVCPSVRQRYGFNMGPAFTRGTNRTEIAARAAVNTSLSGCAGALAVLAFIWFRTSKYDLRNCCNGALSGLVGITPLAPHVVPWCASKIQRKRLNIACSGFFGGPPHVVPWCAIGRRGHLSLFLLEAASTRARRCTGVSGG